MGKAGSHPEATMGVTLSTRVDRRQREVIERAAKAVDCSPGKFVRDAAVQRAADVLNASGGAEAQLRELARRLVGHCFHFRIVQKGEKGKACLESGLYEPWQPDVETRAADERLDADWLTRQNTDAVAAIRRALETAPTEFVRFFLEEWDRWGKVDLDYQPCVDPREVRD